ncbi:VOC family protein [Spartinivicinus ruber]|uniref:VOC family protein n=1 Tax=Spartinivicinus ruber TaxID=2683272 RepID=UPI0013D7DF69|nr:VOC family protein [Spartinivicinus ruber]
MPKLFIFVPVDDAKIAEVFFVQILDFKQKRDFFVPKNIEYDEIGIRLQMDREIREKNKKQSRVALFTYFVEKNFLSYCKKIKDQGVKFTLMCSHPGGYAACILDPFGNEIQIESESFDDEDSSIDPSDWPIYERY